MKRLVGVAVIAATFAGLALVFFRGIGRIDPIDQYEALLQSRLEQSGGALFRWGSVDPPARLEAHGQATAVAIFIGRGLDGTLTFTVYEDAGRAVAAETVVRERYSDRETFQDINTWGEEFCVRLPRHRLDCFRSVDNLFLHSSVTPLPQHWEQQPFLVEFAPLRLLRTGYKLWLAYVRTGRAFASS